MEYIGIFQGGGMKGLAYAGAVSALEEYGFKMVKASGTSIGAVFAGIFASGYSGIEAFEVIKDFDFSKLVKKENSFVNVIKEKGFHTTYYLEEFMAYLLAKKGVVFFKDLKNEDGYKLKVVGYDFTKRKKIVFPDTLKELGITEDYFPVAKAIAMSSTFPAFFRPQKLNGDIIVDGGIIDNFPNDLHSDDYLKIGFQILPKNKKGIPSDIPIVKIETKKYKTLNFKMSKSDQYELYKKGYIEGKKIAQDLLKKISQ